MSSIALSQSLSTTLSQTTLRVASSSALHASPVLLSRGLQRMRTGRAMNAGARKQQARSFLTIIQQGHEGWRLTYVCTSVCIQGRGLRPFSVSYCRFGRDPVKLTPGLNIQIPLVHTVQRLDMRESSVSIPNLPGMTTWLSSIGSMPTLDAQGTLRTMFLLSAVEASSTASLTVTRRALESATCTRMSRTQERALFAVCSARLPTIKWVVQQSL